MDPRDFVRLASTLAVAAPIDPQLLDALLVDPTRRAHAAATIRANCRAVTDSPPPSQS